MRQLEIVNKAMGIYGGSFINHLNELVLIPRFNVYFSLDDVETEEDFLCKMCEWISRDCCCALRYHWDWRNVNYWSVNRDMFNQVCGTDFSAAEMEMMYECYGNRVRHEDTMIFVRSGFDADILHERHEEVMKGF